MRYTNLRITCLLTYTEMMTFKLRQTSQANM